MRHAILGLTGTIMLSFAGAAMAANADGQWMCKAQNNTPIAIVTISGSGYTYEETNAGEQPNGKGGTGTLQESGGFIVPVDGPLTNFEAGGLVENGVLYWNNSAGTILACWPR